MRLFSSTLLSFVLLFSAGCGVVSNDPNLRPGELKTDSVHLDANGVDNAAVALKIGVGDLVIGSDTGELVTGKFEYNVPAWQPVVNQSKDGSTAHLKVEQPSAGSVSGDTQNRWNLQVSNKTPVAFDIECGVGKAKLNLGGMKLKDVTLKVGVGEIDMDLRGNPEQDYNVRIEGGVGQATINLPASAAIRADVQTGLGGIDVQGLEKHGDSWQSANYGKAKATIHLTAKGGIGEIKLVRAAETN